MGTMLLHIVAHNRCKPLDLGSLLWARATYTVKEFVGTILNINLQLILDPSVRRNKLAYAAVINNFQNSMADVLVSIAI